jgi:predicted nucleic acid-binding protein
MLKRRRISIEEAVEGMTLFRRMRIELRDVDLAASVKLCGKLGIYAYDAYLLQCAIDAPAPLLTLDGGLRTAGRSLGVSLFEIYCGTSEHSLKKLKLRRYGF